MKLSVRDLVISALFIITISTLVSNLYQPIWGYVYAVVNLVAVTSFSLFKDSWYINKNSLNISVYVYCLVFILVILPLFQKVKLWH